jgi:hypothetical protein
MVVIGVRMARAVGWMGVLHCAQQIQGAIRGRRGHSDCWRDHFGLVCGDVWKREVVEVKKGRLNQAWGAVYFSNFAGERGNRGNQVRTELRSACQPITVQVNYAQSPA